MADIIISATGTKDKADLDGCYFLPATPPATGYDFYDANDTLVTSSITGDTFNFQLPDYDFDWTISDLVISDTAASGTWTNTDLTVDGTDPENGDFTASSSGGHPEETSSIASA